MVKRLIVVGAAVGLALSALPVSASQGTTGNGAPSGAHYDLNIHGTNGTPDKSLNSNGHDIFVPLNSNGTLYHDSTVSKDCDDISLTEGSTFQVLNPDCWNGSTQYQGPTFQLPDPNSSGACPTGYYCTAYTVWARALTKGSATMQTCYTDTTGTTYCATGAQVLTLKKNVAGSGGTKFQDATQELLFYCQDTSGGGGTGQLAPLFSNANYDYFWDYDNNGLRLAQLRFYPATSDQISNTTGCTYSTQI